MDMINLVETSLMVAVTIGILEIIKRSNIIMAKFIPAIGLIVGIIVCALGAAAGVLPVDGWSKVIWYGIITGLMACGLFSGVKNTVGK
jgi:uncharacterized membrane protein